MVDPTTEYEGTEDESSEPGSDAEPDAEHYAAEIADAAQAADYETLFARIVEGVAEHGVWAIDDAMRRSGTWAVVDQLADADLQHFLGWYDWSADSAKELLAQDTRLMDRLAELRANVARAQEYGEYQDAIELGRVRPKAIAQYATEYLAGGDLPNFFAYLDSVASGDLMMAMNLMMRDSYQRGVLERAAQSEPDAFLAGLNAASFDVQAALRSNGVVDAITQQRRRAQRWQPSTEDLGFISGTNRLNVKDLADRQSTHWVAGGFVVLIGDNHDPAHVEGVNAETDRAAGQVSVRKGGIFGAGTLTFTGVPPNKRELVKSAVARFSDKAVKFA
ncbi:MAG TPA: hypothetical protein VHC23_14925 [Jatrophihabitans sp.]|jgi:hypothetical protein|nr:hypothetical protein [Jatrophihabitans sp.]